MMSAVRPKKLTQKIIVPSGDIPDPQSLEVHTECCAKCPSAHGSGHDPETRDILTWDKSERMETVFACAWRPDKLCKGYYDLMTKEVTNVKSNNL